MPQQVLAVGVLLAAPLAAQTVLLELGPYEEGDYGTTVCGLGDIDGDGVPDLAVGAPSLDVGYLYAGRLRDHSGADGSVIWQRTGKVMLAGFGTRLAPIGDLDGDGVDDVLMGGRHLVLVLSGVDGKTIHDLGYAGDCDIAAVGDLDGDGVEDFAVGDGIRVRVFSGTDASVLLDRRGSSGFGTLVLGSGDLDLDGVPDLAAAGWSSRLEAFSGTTGTTLWTHGSDAEPIQAAARLDDRDGDGVPEVLVGTGAVSGRVRVLSGLDGTVLHEFAQPDVQYLGGVVEALGDANGDGIQDFAASCWVAPNMQVRVLSGADGALLFRRVVLAEYAGAFANVGDHDGDGSADLIVGEPLKSFGYAQLLSSRCAPDGSASYCPPTANSAHPDGARLTALGSHSLAAETFGLRVEHLPPGQFGFFLWERGMQDVPWGDGSLCIGPAPQPIGPPASTGAAGAAGLRFKDLPPFAAGDVIRFQFWYRDPAGQGAGHNTSNALRTSFCR